MIRERAAGIGGWVRDACGRAWGALRVLDICWRAWGALRVPLANLSVATAVALLAALSALVVEDALPVNGQPRRFDASRIAVFLISLVLLAGAVFWRSVLHRRTGTLFYLRVLDQSMEDWQEVPAGAASRSRMSLRSVTRWVDLPSSTHNGVIDLTASCADVSAALELLVNTDRDDTGYTIAPNMLWPQALAVGAALPVTAGSLKLLELPGRPPSAAGTGRRPARGVSPVPLPDAGQIRSATGTAIAVRTRAIPGAPAQASRIGVILAFAKSMDELNPEKIFAGWGVTEYHWIQPACWTPPGWLSGDQPGTPRADLTVEQLAALARELPGAVAGIKHDSENAGRELVIAAAMPKILALALGWGLAQKKRLPAAGAERVETPVRFFTGTHLLHWDSTSSPATRGFRPMRVHPAQPATCPAYAPCPPGGSPAP